MVVEEKISTVSKVLILQILIILIVTLGFYFVGGSQKALSPLLGGIVAFIPNLYFALRIAKTTGQNAQQIVRVFYAGETGKLLLTGLLFFIIFQIPDIELLPLLTGYMSALSIFWFALIMRD